MYITTINLNNGVLKTDIEKHLKNNDLYECLVDIEIKNDKIQTSIEKGELVTNETIKPVVSCLIDNPNLFKKIDYSDSKYYYNVFGNRGIIIPSYNENKIIYYSGIRIRLILNTFGQIFLLFEAGN
jgi:hypothetical protein